MLCDSGQPEEIPAIVEVRNYVRRFLADFETNDDLFGEAAEKLLSGLFSHERFSQALVDVDNVGGDVSAALGVASENFGGDC